MDAQHLAKPVNLDVLYGTLLQNLLKKLENTINKTNFFGMIFDILKI